MRSDMAEDEKAFERRRRLAKQAIGERLKAARGDRSMDEVAEQAGLPAPTLYRYEGGKMLPGADVLPLLARGYGLTLDELLGCAPEAA